MGQNEKLRSAIDEAARALGVSRDIAERLKMSSCALLAENKAAWTAHAEIVRHINDPVIRQAALRSRSDDKD